MSESPPPPTIDLNGVYVNNTLLTEGIYTWGKFINVNIYDSTDVMTWGKLLIMPFEVATMYRNTLSTNGNEYRLEFSTSADYKYMINMSHVEIFLDNDPLTQAYYNYVLTMGIENDLTSTTISKTITSNASLMPTKYTIIPVVKNEYTDELKNYVFFNQMQFLVVVIPSVDILSVSDDVTVTKKLNEVSDNSIEVEVPSDGDIHNITFRVSHTYPNGNDTIPSIKGVGKYRIDGGGENDLNSIDTDIVFNTPSRLISGTTNHTIELKSFDDSKDDIEMINSDIFDVGYDRTISIKITHI